jgi:hypothetical protein
MHESDHEVAVGMREDLLDRDCWLTSAQVHERMRGVERKPALFTSKKRVLNRLFGVWSHRCESHMHPDFQFVGDRVHARLHELLAALHCAPAFQPTVDKGGWERAFWLFQPRGELSRQVLAGATATGGSVGARALMLSRIDATPRAPVDVFASQPEAVIALAHRDVEGPAARD